MMKIREDLRDLTVHSNVELFLRERGKLIDRRIGHNVFTITGRNLLSKLISWQTIALGGDVPYTNRRVRWMGVGTGTQLEVTTVEALNAPVKATLTDYLVPIQTPVEFPNSTSVRFTREFATGEITTTPTPVVVTEAGLFADVSPAKYGGVARDGTEDFGYGGDDDNPILDPTSGINAPIAYKAFEGLTKTVDFTLTIRWDFRF